ncbi:hypothetical protein C8J56DRAFT_890690 [Mycena floridula]|nr:hypothetical protein C8J56DRAFT_890690 [Mycena floridula]
MWATAIFSGRRDDQNGYVCLSASVSEENSKAPESGIPDVLKALVPKKDWQLQLWYQGKPAIATCVDEMTTTKAAVTTKAAEPAEGPTTAATSLFDDDEECTDEDTQPTVAAIVKAAATTVEAKPTTIVRVASLSALSLPLPPLIVKRLLLPMRASFRGCSYTMAASPDTISAHSFMLSCVTVSLHGFLSPIMSASADYTRS